MNAGGWGAVAPVIRGNLVRSEELGIGLDLCSNVRYSRMLSGRTKGLPNRSFSYLKEKIAAKTLTELQEARDPSFSQLISRWS